MSVSIVSNTRAASPCESMKQQVNSFADYSQCERDEFAKLNGKMSIYVNCVKRLESDNAALNRELADMKTNWGKESRDVQATFEEVLTETRARIDAVSHFKTIADVRNKRAAYENNEYQKQLENICLEREEYQHKIRNLERQLVQLEDSHACLKEATQAEIKDIERYKITRDNTWTLLVELLDKLDDELFKRIGLEFSNQTLKEQIEFNWQRNEREMCEMEQLSHALPFNEQVEFYKGHLKRVISSIRKDYEKLESDQAALMDEWIKTKKDELANMYADKDPLEDLEASNNLENIRQLKAVSEANSKEIEQLKRSHEQKFQLLQAVEDRLDAERGKVNDTLEAKQKVAKQLNTELDALTDDFNHINVNKATLEYEISVYKRLLNSQHAQYAEKNIIPSQESPPTDTD